MLYHPAVARHNGANGRGNETIESIRQDYFQVLIMAKHYFKSSANTIIKLDFLSNQVL
jgi:hypothetical protein